MRTQTRRDRAAQSSQRAASRLALLAALVAFVALLAPVTAPPLGAAASVGLSSVRSQTFGNEDLFFFQPWTADRFGWAVAAGDFNNDGAMDLATGMPSDDGLAGGGLIDVGIVVVRWGIPGTGLAMGLADTVLSQYAAGSLSAPESNDEFGHALAVGDFNGDGHDDLAVGVPGDNVSGTSEGCTDLSARSGSVIIHYGLPNGIQTAGEHWGSFGTIFGCPGEPGYRLGAALAAGDFNGDGWGDLAVGIPNRFGYDGTDILSQAGSVVVLYGHFGGLVPWDDVQFSQFSTDVHNTPHAFDHFGFALAVGDINDDFRDDLAVGVPGEGGTGAVQLFMGSPTGISLPDNAIWSEFEIVGSSAVNDQFGSALAFGDFNADSIDDLAIGTPLADLPGPKVDAGRVSVMYGDLAILTNPLVSESFTQGTIFGAPAADGVNDRFGRALAAGDFDRDGAFDLAVGQPGDDLGNIDRGGVTILMGSPAGGLYERFRFLSAGIAGIPPDAQNGSDMGHSLAAGDFDGDGHADLAIGVPYRDDAFVDDGRVTVLYGALFADGFEGNSTFDWSGVEP